MLDIQKVGDKMSEKEENAKEENIEIEKEKETKEEMNKEKKEQATLKIQLEETEDRLKRVAAEFDNYKKRSIYRNI